MSEKASNLEKESNLYEISQEKKVLRRDMPDLLAESAEKRLEEIKKSSRA